MRAKFPGESPYSFAFNNPIQFIDSKGEEPVKPKVTTLSGLIKVMRDNNIKNMDEAATFFGGNQLPIFNSGSGDSNKKGAGENNRYLYTKGVGWLDMRHFFDAADAAEDLGAKETINQGEGIEKRQANSNDASAYDYEDLQSNFQGAMFGEDFDGLEGEAFYKALESRFKELGATNPEEAENFNKLKQNYDTETGESNTTYTPLYAPDYSKLPANLTKKGFDVKQKEKDKEKAKENLKDLDYEAKNTK